MLPRGAKIIMPGWPLLFMLRDLNMPIVTAVYGLLKGDDPRAVVSDLLARPLRAEQGHPG